LKTLVIGGGIGGLAAAIALNRAGVPVRVFERARELREAGTALTLWSNAIRAAQKLGVSDAIAAAGTAIEYAEVRNSRGRLLVRTPVGEIGRELGAPSICIPRSALQTILLESIPRDAVRLGVPCESIREDAQSVTAQFGDGVSESGDVLIGADGFHSVVAAQLHGVRAARYGGYTSWRAIAQFSDPALVPGVASESWGCGARFGIVPLSSDRVYWFAKATAPAGGSGEFRRDLFRDWHAPISALIDATLPESILHHDIFDREPILPWGRGRITLLGDAAHPTLPDLAQGACMALEDAVVLSRVLHAGGDPVAALRTYEAVRAPRTSWLTRRARRQSRIGQRSSVPACVFRNLIMRMLPPRWVRRTFQSYLTFTE
jgi:2-polyprenyl-6-methoxyphenol hydroxylase-like FAD-dependent oxidoreductase